MLPHDAAAEFLPQGNSLTIACIVYIMRRSPQMIIDRVSAWQ
jgi:hypothetical protein